VDVKCRLVFKAYMWEVDDGLEKLGEMINTTSAFKGCKIAIHN
jgi:hypothetical protein